MLNQIAMKIKKRETPFYDWLYQTIKAMRKMSFPSIKGIHLPLYHLHKYLFHIAPKTVINALWVVPLFKARIDSGGKGLTIYNGMPYISGEHLVIEVGEDVVMVGNNQFIGGRNVRPDPTIIIGDRVHIGYSCEFSINDHITIGKDTMIATGCNFADSDGHPIASEPRRRHEPVTREDVKPIHIGENVWIGRNAMVLKGVKIGDNSIVAAGAVVTQSIPQNEIWGGIPAKKIGTVPNA